MLVGQMEREKKRSFVRVKIVISLWAALYEAAVVQVCKKVRENVVVVVVKAVLYQLARVVEVLLPYNTL